MRHLLTFSVRKPERLVDFLKNQLKTDRSSKYLRRVLEANLCRVNGRVERFASARLNAGDRIDLASEWEALLRSDQKMEALFEDDHFLIANKPAGWVCNDESAKKTFGPRHYLIHRLDKDTTGLLLIAKTPAIKEKFIALFEKKEVEKFYLALADGIFSKECVEKESFLVKKGTFEGQSIWGSSSSKQGLYAHTRFTPQAQGEAATLIDCRPTTGRTHQIRVHLAEMGHPILIDRQYAATFRCRHFFQRPLLHAARLRFSHPVTEELIDISAPLPDDMQKGLSLVGIR